MINGKDLLWAILGGGIGAGMRFSVSSAWKTASFPFSTLLINIVGSFLIGVLFALSLRNRLPGNMYIFLATGICGGFTTFSTFSLENMLLLQSGRFITAASYMLTSFIGCIAATFIGFKITG